MRVLDSHLHLWDPEVLTYTWLEGPMAYRFADLELEHARLALAEPEKSVFVQAETVEDDFLAEVDWVAGLAPALGIVGIVAGVRLDRGPTRSRTWRTPGRTPRRGRAAQPAGGTGRTRGLGGVRDRCQGGRRS